MSISIEVHRSLTSPSSRERSPSDESGVNLTCLLLFAMSYNFSAQLSPNEPLSKNENG